MPQPLVAQLARRVVEIDQQRPADERAQIPPAAPPPEQQPERQMRGLIQNADDRPARLQRPPQRVGRQRQNR
jgi:hypothetical protein